MKYKIFLLIFMISLSSAGIDGIIGLDLNSLPSEFNNNTAFVNSTEFWITNLGPLSNANSAQFDNIAGTLTIDESHIELIGNDWWLRRDGTNSPTANINWGGFDINNLGFLNILNSGAGIQRVVNTTSTNPNAIVTYGITTDQGGGVVLAAAGSTLPIFANDSGILCRGGRCFIGNDGVGEIVLGHGNTIDGFNFTWSLQPDGTVTQTGPLVMNGSQIFLDGVQDHFITTNIDGVPFNGIAQNATWFGHDFMRDDGEITYLFTWENNTNMWLQAGRNNSFSAIGNSFVLVPQKMASNNFTELDGTINMTKASDYLFICNFFGLDCVFNADTKAEGPLLGTLGPAEIQGGIKGHGGISIDGPAVFNLEGSDMNVNNGSVHIATPVTFEQGFTAGDSVTKFTETFAIGLGIFTNIQSDLGDWVSVLNSVLCDEGQCAQGDGAGVGLVEMQTNVSTLDINETTLSFVYSLVNLIGAGEFSVEVNNNEGSGDVTIFSDTTDTVVKESEIISLPSSMDDKSLVTITFICDVGSAAKPTRQCFADTVKLNGTAITTTLINVSGFDSEICFSDGVRGANGLCSRGLFYNASADLVTTQGTWNISGTVSGGLSGSGSTNNIAKWASGSSLTNSQITDDGVLITLGLPTLMQGNTNSIGFNATYDYIFGNGSQLTDLPSPDLSGFVQNNTDDGYVLIADSFLGNSSLLVGEGVGNTISSVKFSRTSDTAGATIGSRVMYDITDGTYSTAFTNTQEHGFQIDMTATSDVTQDSAFPVSGNHLMIGFRSLLTSDMVYNAGNNKVIAMEFITTATTSPTVASGASLTFQGILGTAGGNLGTVGNTKHIGGGFTATGTADENVAVLVSRVRDGTVNWGYKNEDSVDNWMGIDNSKDIQGTGQDSIRYWDGTNAIWNTTTGFLEIRNNTGLGKIRALEYATSTPKELSYSNEDKYIDTLPKPNELLGVDGKIKQGALRQSQTTYLEKDFDNCWEVIDYIEYCYDVVSLEDEYCVEEKIIDWKNYPKDILSENIGTFYSEECGSKEVNVTLIDTQAFENTIMISELKAEIDGLKTELCTSSFIEFAKCLIGGDLKI